MVMWGNVLGPNANKFAILFVILSVALYPKFYPGRAAFKIGEPDKGLGIGPLKFCPEFYA